MVEVISTGKNTQWHTFPNFQTKCTFSHIANEAVDFQVVPGHNCFLEINKKSGFELLRTVHKNGIDSIQRVKKLQLDGLQCGATSKMFGSEVALGMSTGFIRLFSLQQSEFMSTKLRPDKIGNSVVYLDYSNCDNHLAALYESGDICLYGLKTGIKTDVLRFDGSSTLIRFHPARRFSLAVASYNGAITMYDIQTKKKLFYEKSAHASPTRDIAMTGSSSDIFMSCGYDCNLNVYDLRKRTMVQQYVQPHPLSTVCLSDCGTFCVAGNLKGDIISFDFRNLKESLETKRVHEGGVVRVAFVPNTSDTNVTNSPFAETLNATNNLITTLPTPAAQQKEPTDSFLKFFDLCHLNNEVVSPGKRDSLLDFGAVKNYHDFSIDSVAGSPSRMSIGNPHDLSELRLKRVSRSTLNSTMVTDNAPITNGNGNKRETLVPKISMISEEEIKNNSFQSESKRSRPSDVTNSNRVSSILSELQETDEKTDGSNVTVSPASKKRSSDKENRHSNQQGIESFVKFIKESHVSTPNQLKVKNDFSDTLNVASLRQLLGEIVDEKLNTIQFNVTAQIKSMEETVLKRIEESENEIKFYQEHYYFSGFKSNFNLFKLMEAETDILKEGMAVMLRTDDVAQEYYRLKAENEELKRRLERKS